MTGLPSQVQRYLARHGAKGPWQLGGEDHSVFHGAVVLPSLAEGDGLFATLQSLQRSAEKCPSRFLAVVVLNHSEGGAAADRQQNEKDLARLADFATRASLNLAWVDAISSGLEIPHKQAGVGFARKLGMDLALGRLDWDGDPLLVCLDADTLVEDNYLQSIVRHFSQTSIGAAVLPYRHQPAKSPEQQVAIDRYELFLRSYVFGLQLAGSPYAFNSVGSAMACRASAYIRCGGMNSRKAGEDFYFLQKLAKTDGVAGLEGTTVFPEPRVSHRVPFGTGRSMARLLAGDQQGVLFYPLECFRVLAAWLKAVEQNLSAEAPALGLFAEEISPVLANYLEQLGWQSAWAGLQKTHPSPKQLGQAFHVWFDGFRTLRLIHLLCEHGLKRGEPLALLPEYFAWDERPCPTSVEEMLAELRRDQGLSHLTNNRKSKKLCYHEE